MQYGGRSRGGRQLFSVVARDSKMADTKGGLFAKTVQKHAGRAKEKVSVGVRTYNEATCMEEQW